MKFKMFTVILLAFLALFSFSGCEQEQPEPVSSLTSSESSLQEETMVTITIPASYFEGKTEEEVEAIAKKQGVTSVTQNADGSYCYEMTATAHRRLINEMRITLTESISESPDGTSYPSVKSASISDDLSTLTLKVDAEAYQEGNDRAIVRAVWPSVCAYYYFNNENPDEKSLTVTVLNAEDDSQVEQFVWPEKDAASQETESSEATSSADTQ